MLHLVRLQRVRFSKEEKCFKAPRNGADPGERCVRGLVPALRRAFWPDYEYIRPPVRGKPTGVRGKRAGMIRGEVVHHQLELYVNARSEGRDGISAVREHYDEVLPFTRKALLALEQWGIDPVIAEAVVYGEALDVATKADLIGIDRSGRLVLIEWKCGMDNHFERGAAAMKGPKIEAFSDCPKNQAFLQLLFTKALMEGTFDMPVTRAYVVRVHQEGVTSYQIPDALERERGMFLAHLYWSDREDSHDKKRKRRQ